MLLQPPQRFTAFTFSAVARSYEEDELRKLHDTYGASLRELSLYARTPEVYKELVIREVREMRSDTLLSFIECPSSVSASHLITIVELSSTSRSDFQKKVSSQAVLEILLQHANDQASQNTSTDSLRAAHSLVMIAYTWLSDMYTHSRAQKPSTGTPLPRGRAQNVI